MVNNDSIILQNILNEITFAAPTEKSSYIISLRKNFAGRLFS